MVSFADKIKQARATVMAKRKELLHSVRSRVGIRGMGLDEMLDITLQDVTEKGLLETISSKIKVQRARIRQKIGIKSQILPDISGIFKGKAFQRRRIYAPKESKTVPPAGTPKKEQPTVPAPPQQGESMELGRIMGMYARNIRKRTM